MAGVEVVGMGGHGAHRASGEAGFVRTSLARGDLRCGCFKGFRKKDRATIGDHKACAVMDEDDDGGLPCPFRAERPRNEGTSGSAEGEEGCATDLMGDICDHTLGPAVEGVAIAVEKLWLSDHIIPETGFVWSEEDECAVAEAVAWVCGQSTEIGEPMLGGEGL